MISSGSITTGFLAALVLAGVCVLTVGAEAQDKQKKTHGKLEKNTAWSGKVLIDGDVEVPKDVVLTILPGTEIRVMEGDFTKGGWNGTLAEIHVIGSLQIQGTEDQPVVFRSVAAEKLVGDEKPPRRSWHGIVLRPHESVTTRSTITSVRVQNAFAGFQIPFGTPAIRDSVFTDCMIGVEVGSAYRDAGALRSGVRRGPAGPEVRRSRFANCNTGVYCEGEGSPDVRKCVFYRCTTGLGNSRPGITSTLHDPGPVAERCAFVNNATGVIGQSLVRDSIFLDNKVAMRLSNFHAKYSVQIDHAAMRSNLFHRNGDDIVGDIGLDNDPISGDPRFAGPMTDLEQPGPALPPCLKLAGSSPARKRAADGGDLGPLSTAMGQRDEAKWNPIGSVIGGMYVLQAAEGVDDRRASRGAPRAGKRVGKSWWVAAIQGEQNEIDLGTFFGRKSKSGYVAFQGRVATGGKIMLEINGDVGQVEVFANGKPAGKLERRRRFGVEGALVEVETRRGTNNFCVKLEAWGRSPRLGFSFPEGATGDQPRKGQKASIEVNSARMVKRRDDCYIDLAMSSTLSWANAGRLGLFTITDGSGKKLKDQERIDVEVITTKKLRLTNVPRDWSDPIQVVLEGLYGPDGEIYGKTKPVTVK